RGNSRRKLAYAIAAFLGAAMLACALFLLPGGRPRRLVVTSDIQDGGRPRRRPRPSASLSKLTIAASICSLSAFNSARILLTSISQALPATRFHNEAGINKETSLVDFSIHSDFGPNVTYFRQILE